MQCATNQRVRNHSVYYKEKIDKKFLYGISLNLCLNHFRFPVEGCKPLQDPPTSDVAKATELISCLERLLPAVSKLCLSC